MKKRYPWIWELHQETNRPVSVPLDPSEWPPEWKHIEFKEYERYPTVELPQPVMSLATSISTVLQERRSRILSYEDGIPSLQQISNLLHWSAGCRSNIRGDSDRKDSGRFYPSAGGRYPLEVYLATRESATLPRGVYHYNVKLHALEKLIHIESEEKVYHTLTGSPFSQTPLVLMITGVFERSMMKYREGGYRFILLEAGALMENLYLVSEALGLSCSACGRSVSHEIDRILELPEGEESLLALLTFGIRK